MLGIGVLLDIICFKFRKVAMVLFYYECVLIALLAFVPIDYGYSAPFISMVNFLFTVTMFGCHAGIDIVISLILFFLIQFLIKPNVFS